MPNKAYTNQNISMRPRLDEKPRRNGHSIRTNSATSYSWTTSNGLHKRREYIKPILPLLTFQHQNPVCEVLDVTETTARILDLEAADLYKTLLCFKVFESA